MTDFESGSSALEQPDILLTDENGFRYEHTDEGISVFNGNEPIGQIRLRIVEKGERKLMAIDDIGVNKEFRNKGVGSRLTDLAEEIAIHEGVSEITALAQPDYLKQLVDKHGYTSFGYIARKPLGDRI